jgi:hypothetical protein
VAQRHFQAALGRVPASTPAGEDLMTMYIAWQRAGRVDG